MPPPTSTTRVGCPTPYRARSAHPFAAAEAIGAVSPSPGAELVTLTLSDDDGGSVVTDAGVIVTGTAETSEPTGWWKHQYSGSGAPHIDDATAAGYLAVVNAVSSVFSEAVAASSAVEAHAALSPAGGDRRGRATAALLVAWLQFASGAVAHDATVPLPGGSTGWLPRADVQRRGDHPRRRIHLGSASRSHPGPGQGAPCWLTWPRLRGGHLGRSPSSVPVERR